MDSWERDCRDGSAWGKRDETRSITNEQVWRHLSAVPPPLLSSFFAPLSHLSADSVVGGRRERGRWREIAWGQMRHPQIACFFLLCSGRDGELPCLVVHAGNRHVCDAPDTGVITHERQKIELTLVLRRAVGSPAAIGPCLFDMGAHRSVVEFNPRYRPPGLDTASLQSVKYRCKEIKLEKKEEN